MSFDAGIRISGCLAAAVTLRDAQGAAPDRIGMMDDDETPAMDAPRPGWRSRFRRSQSLNYLRQVSIARRGATGFLAGLAQIGTARRAPVRALVPVQVKIAPATLPPKQREIRVPAAQIISGRAIWLPVKTAARPQRSHHPTAPTFSRRSQRSAGLFDMFLGLLETDAWLSLLQDALMMGYGAVPMARWQVLSGISRVVRQGTVHGVEPAADVSEHDDERERDQGEGGQPDQQDEPPTPVYMEDESVVHTPRALLR